MSESTLSVLRPVTIDDTTLTSTTEAEADHAAYNPAEVAYALGDRVIVVATHRIYERATATATAGKDPTDINNRIADAAGIIWWFDVSATNAWKMFDGEKSSQTVATSPLTIVLEPGFVGALYVGKISNCDTATITMDDAPGGTEVFNEVIALENSDPGDYYEYHFSPFEQQPDFVIDDLPPYNLGEITITFAVTSGSISVGMLQVGDLAPLGETQGRGRPRSRPKSFSYIKIDEFGDNEIIRRKSAKDMDVEAVLELDYANTAESILTEVQDIASLWVASTGSKFAGMRAFGIGKGQITYTSPTQTLCTLSLKVTGLI
tara:strand:+ start:4870 stop:5826 length:957 start_codon:yes stop_codon:yes gene_type:complete